MRITNPFITHSPYEEIEISRRERLLIEVSKFMAIFAIILIPIVGVMLLYQFSWQVVLALALSASIAPLSLFSRRLAQRNKADLASYILLPSILLIVAVNATLIEGLFPIMVPGFILLIVVAGMLMGPRLSYTVSIIAALTWFIAIHLLNSGTLIPSPLPENVSQISVTIISVLAFIFVAILSQLATSDLRKALSDATYDLVQVNRQLEEASELKSQFTARTSHELRTPLSAIIALADLASRGTYGPLTEEMENSLTLILQSARRLNSLIDDILDLSRMEAGELKIVKEKFDVHVLRDTVDSTLKENALKKGLGFKFTIPVDMPRYIVGDEKRISQILINLTDNAIKFTEDGSVKVGLRTHGDKEWVISVMDTGRGIPEDKFESIFDEFRQLDNITIDAEKRGTGLGLAITFELVQMMGGRINLQSEIGQGSLFEVFLPLNVPQAIDQDARPVPVSIQ